MPQNIKDYLLEVIKQLDEKNKQAKIKWVEKQNLHLTLFYLGELTQNQVETLEQQLKNIRADHLDLELGRLGAFPNDHQARVIKISLAENNKLHKIYKKIKQIIIHQNIDLDKKTFDSHITLGRVKNNDVKINLDLLIEPFKCKIHSIDLMKSRLTSSGPVYTMINKINLI